jgi:hypothetical protein
MMKITRVKPKSLRETLILNTEQNTRLNTLSFRGIYHTSNNMVEVITAPF